VEGVTVKRLVGLLGWLGVALVVVALVLRFTRPELQPWYRGLAIAGLIVTALYALTQWRDIGRSFQGKNVRYGSLTAGSVAVVLAILVGLNWIASRQNKRWDFTEGGQYSLSDQTRQLLRGLDRPLTMKVFYRGGTGEIDRFRDQLGEYQYTSSQVQVEYIDPDQDPMKAKALDVQSYGTIVLEYDGRVERTTSTDEQGLANALKRLLEGTTKKIYFSRGHGERDSAGSGAEAYSEFANALKSENFEVATLALAQSPTVPDDTTVLVVAGPKSDFLPAEIDAVKAYLGRGGKLLLMIDPPESPTSPPVANLVALAKEWAINVGTNVVVDQQSIQTPVFPVVVDYPPHAITENFSRVMTAFLFTRTVEPVDGGADGRFAQKLLETSPRSWAESDLAGLFKTGKPQPDLDKGDKQGPVAIAAAVTAPAATPPATATPPEPDKPEAPKPETRLVVMGDSDFVSNQSINSIQGNRDLGLNIANWLAQQENLIAIRAKNPTDRRLTLTQEQGQAIFWLTLFVVPGLLFATAFRVWWKRR
jgi:ABC-type uncharacterized transport system involved in gliding motility auxiliary subunit